MAEGLEVVVEKLKVLGDKFCQITPVYYTPRAIGPYCTSPNENCKYCKQVSKNEYHCKKRTYTPISNLAYNY